MKKDTHSQSAVSSKRTAPGVAMSGSATTQQREQRMDAASSASPWSSCIGSRYIDSRLKQFSCR